MWTTPLSLGDLFCYTSSTQTWTNALVPYSKESLSDLSETVVLNTAGLPTGNYIFYFAVDMNMNGTINYDQFADLVNVSIK